LNLRDDEFVGLFGHASGRSLRQGGETMAETQKLPVRIYQSDDRIMIAAPMPGLEPGDILVRISGNKVTIQGQYRGPRQEERDLLMAEWTTGPYFRELTLPAAVNGALANATFGNGVLVLAIPKLPPGQEAPAAEFQLEVIEAPRGERVGHAGQDLHPVTTAEHRRLAHESPRAVQ
jgi:HSP20 family protein